MFNPKNVAKLLTEKYLNSPNTPINDIERYYADRFVKELENDGNMHCTYEIEEESLLLEDEVTTEEAESEEDVMKSSESDMGDEDSDESSADMPWKKSPEKKK